MNEEKFEKDMAVFSFKQHQDVLTYLVHLTMTGWTIEDARQWIENKKKGLVKVPDLPDTSRRLCPKCQGQMVLLSVNYNKATQTGDDSNSVWICQNKECMHTKYSTKTIQEQMKELLKK